MELSITSMINIKKAVVTMMEEELGVLTGRAYIVHKARIDEIKREIREMEERGSELSERASSLPGEAGGNGGDNQ